MELNKQNTKQLIKISLISITFYLALSRFNIVADIFSQIWNFTFVFILGGAMAFIFNVPMKKVEGLLKINNKSARRLLAYVLTLSVFVFGVLAVLFIVVPEIINTMNMIIVQIENVLKQTPQMEEQILKVVPELEVYINSIGENWSDMMKIAQTILMQMLNSGASLVSGVVSSATTFIIALIFSIYVLLNKELLSKGVKHLLYAFLDEKKADRTVYIGRLTNKTFSNFMSGQCTEAMILGSLFFVAMIVTGMPYALLISVVIGVMSLIPILGAFVGCFIGIFLIIMVDPVKAIWFLVMFLIIQQLENNLIYPRIVGQSVGLPAILVFTAVSLGGKLMGVAGMLTFIPMCSIVFTLVNESVKSNLNKKNIDKSKLN